MIIVTSCRHGGVAERGARRERHAAHLSSTYGELIVSRLQRGKPASLKPTPPRLLLLLLPSLLLPGLTMAEGANCTNKRSWLHHA